MKKHLNLLCVAALTLVTTIGLFTRYVNDAHAQPNCCTPPLQSPLTPKWPMGATVTVTISTQFTSDEKSDIVEAFQAWNNAQLCAGVSFTGFQSGENQPPPSMNTYWVHFIDSEGFGGVTAINELSGDNAWARTALYKGIRTYWEDKRAYTRSVMRHEIGHTLFLANSSCQCS